MRVFTKRIALLCVVTIFFGLHLSAGSLKVVVKEGENVVIDLTDGLQAQMRAAKDGKSQNLFIFTGRLAQDDSAEDGINVEDDGIHEGKIYLKTSLSNVDSIEFDNTSGVEDIAGIENGKFTVRILLADKRVDIANVTAPVDVKVYSIDGRLELHRTLSSDGSVSLVELGRGVHVLAAGSKTYKIIL